MIQRGDCFLIATSKAGKEIMECGGKAKRDAAFVSKGKRRRASLAAAPHSCSLAGFILLRAVATAKHTASSSRLLHSVGRNAEIFIG